ncbi:tRNA 2-thiouridine(34) synthase MnmA [Anaerovorax odorimutans]|uniref:tRNA 2-thiouridine(34) synthase MnmA n=1 Tax=Anaerovorax odorimutans TaxID=109327 RepID=UPI0004049AD8|nr:tRNA 2-thiouridine(34) synthase MnmA [Anaerovorax odorimutans]
MHDLQKNNKVLLGLSGGVDSTAAALLLQKEGFEVTGLFFDVLGDQSEAKEKAQNAAKELNIDFIYTDVSKEFECNIIEYFCNSYLVGETPNPCVKCNPTIKFKTLLEEADRLGIYYIATGHYAQIFYDAEIKKYFVKKGDNEKKDQSYMIYRLNQSILSRLLLPLGTVNNKEITRDLVREKGINNADTKDSQEICFINDNNYVNFIKNRKSFNEVNKIGNFIDKEGKILGKHQGLVNYTIGQRKGLGITFGKPIFVISMDKENNTVTLGDNEELFTNNVISNNNFFIVSQEGNSNLPMRYKGKKIIAKIRYSAKPAKAVLHGLSDGKIQTTFDEVQRAVTPGQSIVFYENNIVIGGGVICY